MTDSFSIPELTRQLRSFASPRALGAMHDRYFTPLLDARRAAKTAVRWEARLTALDAERLEATMRATLGTFAAERFPQRAPDRRALTARLEDGCGDLFDALETLAATQRDVRAAPDDAARAEHWIVWVAALRQVFAAADRGWEHVAPMLDAPGVR
jgi:hypothetical protein